MAQKTSINIKPCNIGSSEAHNKRTAEYLVNIRKEKFYIRTDLMAGNETWVSPDFGEATLTDRYNQIAAMVKEKTGRAMQTKDRERVNKKTGKVTVVRGSTPLKEGVVVIKEDTTMEQLRHFCEVCKERWGITPLQVFIHRDEGHYSNPQDIATWKPNLHAHIVWDWMDHETGKSCKLNEKAMCEMQTVLAECLEMQRGISKRQTSKEHLERNDFIIAKQKSELQRIDAAKQDKEYQVKLAKLELKQIKSEIRTDRLKSAATNVATAIASGVGSLFGSGKLKELEHSIKELYQEIATRDKSIDKLNIQIQRMQELHNKQIHNHHRIHSQELEAKDQEISRLNTLLEKAFKWFPMFKEILSMEKLCTTIGLNKDTVDCLLVKKEAIHCNGNVYSEGHRRMFEVRNGIFKVERNPTDEDKLVLTINKQPIGEWFKEQMERLQQVLRNKAKESRKSRGFKL